MKQREYYSTLLGTLFLLFLNCANSDLSPIPFYQPVITFSGSINGGNIDLPGYYAYPNKCVRAGDTLKMDFYSDDYSPSSGDPQGIYLRLQIYPRPADSLATTFTTRRLMVHMTRHYATATCTYEIVPADSNNLTNSISMKLKNFGMKSGTDIGFQEIQMNASAIGLGCPERLMITNGVISGKVQ